jgi:hypothetical protein
VEAHARLLLYFAEEDNPAGPGALAGPELPTAGPPPLAAAAGATAEVGAAARGGDQGDNGKLDLGVAELSLVSSDLFLALPCVVAHRIDRSSPLWGFAGPEPLERRRAELLLLLEGSTASTSQTVQACEPARAIAGRRGQDGWGWGL